MELLCLLPTEASQGQPRTLVPNGALGLGCEFLS